MRRLEQPLWLRSGLSPPPAVMQHREARGLQELLAEWANKRHDFHSGDYPPWVRQGLARWVVFPPLLRFSPSFRLFHCQWLKHSSSVDNNSEGL